MKHRQNSRVTAPVALIDPTGFHLHEKEATMGDEASVSHYLRSENSILPHGWPYGRLLASVCADRGWIGEGTKHIVEVGPGLLDLALNAAPMFMEQCPNLRRHTLLELSPKLARRQHERIRESGIGLFKQVVGDAVKIDELLKTPSEFLFSNEAVGDFRAVQMVPRERGGRPSGDPESKPLEAFDVRSRKLWEVAWDKVERYNLDVPTPNDAFNFIVQTGLIDFIERLPRVLADGGKALLIEHSSKFSKKLRLRGHHETLVSFLHLPKVAEGNGFNVEYGSLSDLLVVGEAPATVDNDWVN